MSVWKQNITEIVSVSGFYLFSESSASEVTT